MPLVRLVTRLVASDNPAEDLAKIDIRREALCEYSLALPPGKPGKGRLGGAPRRPDRSRSVFVAATAGDRRELPSGPAVHDRRQSRAGHRVNGDFMGCVVEPGNNEVRLEFRPDSLLRGRMVMLAGLR